MPKTKQAKSPKTSAKAKSPKGTKKSRSRGSSRSDHAKTTVDKPKKPKKKSKPKKQPSRAKKTKVDEQADTIMDARRPVPGIKPGREKRGWRWADLLLTGLFIVALALLTAGIWLVNTWSVEQGASGVHALSIAHVPERARSYILHLKKRYSPPSQHRPSLGYEKEIQAAALKYRVPANLLKAVIQAGSAFRPEHVDRYGAIGLMQITPSATKALGSKPLQLFHPDVNIQAGARLLRQQLDSMGKRPHTQQAIKRYFASVRGLSAPPKSDDSPAGHFAWKVMRAYHSFQKDPGQEIRRASKRNRNRPQTRKRRSWLSWKRLKSFVKRQKRN